jgi:uncharacterized protein GlcG (DUF336 family)
VIRPGLATIGVSLLLAGSPLLGQSLSVADIRTVVAQAASRARELTNNPIHTNAVIAVVDREGYVVGAWTLNAGFAGDPQFPAFLRNAIGKAGTASFLSSSQHAFSTRTAQFIVQQNFPPGVLNKPPGPLVGVNFSNFQFSDVHRYKDPAGFVAGVTNGLNGGTVPIPATGGLAGANGGVPLYKNGVLVGGIGVAGDEEKDSAGSPLPLPPRVDAPMLAALPELAIAPALARLPDADEAVALAGQIGFAPSPRLFGSKVFVDGVALAYVETPAEPASTPLPFGDPQLGVPVPQFPIVAPPPLAYPPLTLGGVNGELRQPIQDDPKLHDSDTANDAIQGQARLTAAEVQSILELGAKRARTTRAGIRLPRGRPMQAFITVVANPDKDGEPAPVLGTFCTSPDTTRFSWDVAVQKARTALFFSDGSRAFSTRTVGFLAQEFYPPGIAGTSPGPFRGLQEKFSALPIGFTNPLNHATVPKVPDAGVVNPNLPNGITIFPGGFPLYRNGVLIGAIGVSGDGIDQDDIVAASGCRDFPAPRAIRADRFTCRGARLPYAKFPRNPAL